MEREDCIDRASGIERPTSYASDEPLLPTGENAIVQIRLFLTQCRL
jgi:hypothetical protein